MGRGERSGTAPASTRATSSGLRDLWVVVGGLARGRGADRRPAGAVRQDTLAAAVLVPLVPVTGFLRRAPWPNRPSSNATCSMLEATLRKLETEYNHVSSRGQLPEPPMETRQRVEALLRRFDRAYIQSAIDRFRLSTLQSRFSTFAELWDRGLRAREEGRPGPFYKAPRARRRTAAANAAGAPTPTGRSGRRPCRTSRREQREARGALPVARRGPAGDRGQTNRFRSTGSRRSSRARWRSCSRRATGRSRSGWR